METLWLFDIDGTLVNINPVHIAAYKNLYKDFLHVDVPKELIVSTFGMSETDMHQVIFRAISKPYDKTLVNRILKNHPLYFKNALKNTSVLPLPGVLKFLNQLKNKHQHIGIVTGNLKKNAELILERSNLKKYFSFLATDNGHLERWQIVRNGIKKASSLKYNYDAIVVIGDTDKDIAAARKAAAVTKKRIIATAVATGTCSFAFLKKHKPDALLKTMKEYEKIIEYVSSSV
ncbi:MAG TPA: HAD hydrolase-like protein [Candidatus Nanoarchaeia archaeon]|nr:HAD hydrolase-like protein [Candidatus Nanoarchaeia archaeon]